jgi:hypothetical protein
MQKSLTLKNLGICMHSVTFRTGWLFLFRILHGLDKEGMECKMYAGYIRDKLTAELF